MIIPYGHFRQSYGIESSSPKFLSNYQGILSYAFYILFVCLFVAVLGFATTVVPRWLTYYVSSGLFALFGIKMIREGTVKPVLGGHRDKQPPGIYGHFIL